MVRNNLSFAILPYSEDAIFVCYGGSKPPPYEEKSSHFGVSRNFTFRGVENFTLHQQNFTFRKAENFTLRREQAPVLR